MREYVLVVRKKEYLLYPDVSICKTKNSSVGKHSRKRSGSSPDVAHDKQSSFRITRTTTIKNDLTLLNDKKIATKKLKIN